MPVSLFTNMSDFAHGQRAGRCIFRKRGRGTNNEWLLLFCCFCLWWLVGWLIGWCCCCWLLLLLVREDSSQMFVPHPPAVILFATLACSRHPLCFRGTHHGICCSFCLAVVHTLRPAGRNGPSVCVVVALARAPPFLCDRRRCQRPSFGSQIVGENR